MRITDKDLKYLKMADKLVFRLLSTNAETLECKGVVECQKKQEVLHTFGVDSVYHTYAKPYDGFSKEYLNRDVDAACGIYTDTIQIKTVINTIQAGDEIVLEWVSDNNSNLIRDAKLHRDELNITIKRGNKIFGFHIYSNIYKNNFARMIREVNFQITEAYKKEKSQ